MKNLNEIHYLERKPLRQMDKNPLIILIHGYGSNEADLFGFADELPDEFHVVSVRAPHTLAEGMFAWYAIDFINMEKFNNIPQGIDSRNQLVAFADALVKKENLDENNVWLCGFSQGAILSYSMALNFPKKFKNVAILSGYPEPNFIGETTKGNANFDHLNFFVSHGKDDMVIPVEWARKGPELLDELNIKNQYREYAGGHGIVAQNFYDLIHWMKQQLAE